MDRTTAKFCLYCPFCGEPTEVSIDDQKTYLEHVAAHCISLYSSISDVDERRQVAPLSRMELLSRLSTLLSSLVTLSNALWNQPKTKSSATSHQNDNGSLLMREFVNSDIFVAKNAEETCAEKGTRTTASASKHSAKAFAFPTKTVATEDPRLRKRKHQ